AGAIRLFGVVDGAATGLPYAARARVRHLDLAAVKATLPRSDLTGHVAGRGAITTLDTPLEMRLRLDPSRLQGTDIEQARLAGRIVSEGLDARGVVVARAGRAAIDGHLSWSGEPSYHARARLQVVDLSALLPSLPGSGRLRATVEGRGFPGPGRSATLRADVDGARLLAVPIDGGSARLTLRGDTLRVEDATVLARGVRAGATGTADLQRETVDATITAAGHVAASARAGGAHVAGAMTARATVRGPLRQLTVDGTLTAKTLRTGSATLRRAALTATMTGVGGETPAGRLNLELGALRVAQSSPWSGTVAA